MSEAAGPSVHHGQLGYPSRHVPAVHCANVSQVDVVELSSHGCPSAMTVGHVPVVDVDVVGQVPTRHKALSLHGWPASTQVTAVHWWVEKTQVRPEAQSLLSAQGPPAELGLWQVDVPFTAGQTSGEAHCSSASHGAPAPAGAAHCPVVLQTRPVSHWDVDPLQLAPAAPYAMATHVRLPPAEPLQVAFAGQGCPSEHDCPTATAGVHVPQALMPPSEVSFPAEHSSDWHWSSLTHAAPEARVPVSSKLQGPGSCSTTEHPLDLMADAQASRLLDVKVRPGRASAAAQRVSKRPWTRVSSVAGGAMLPPQELANTASK